MARGGSYTQLTTGFPQALHILSTSYPQLSSEIVDKCRVNRFLKNNLKFLKKIKNKNVIYYNIKNYINDKK